MKSRTGLPNTHSRRQPCGKCVPVVEHGPLESSNVQFSVVTGVALDRTLDSPDSNFGAAVGVWERPRRSDGGGRHSRPGTPPSRGTANSGPPSLLSSSAMPKVPKTR